MGKMKHAAEPWLVAAHRKTDKVIRIPKPGIAVDNDDVPPGEGLANARRAADCVNACAGLADPRAAVEQLVVLARDLYDLRCGGHSLDCLGQQIEEAAKLLPWPTDRCWGCGADLTAKGAVEEDCCAGCARVVQLPEGVAR